MDDIQDFLSFFILSKEELLLVLAIVLVMILLSFALPRLAFFLYERFSSDTTQEVLKEIIYCLDKLADDLSNKEKRINAIYKLQMIFSFKGIKIPRFILGWIIDMEVRQIRKLQKECKKESNLHNENEDE